MCHSAHQQHRLGLAVPDRPLHHSETARLSACENGSGVYVGIRPGVRVGSGRGVIAHAETRSAKEVRSSRNSIRVTDLASTLISPECRFVRAHLESLFSFPHEFDSLICQRFIVASATEYPSRKQVPVFFNSGELLVQACIACHFFMVQFHSNCLPAPLSHKKPPPTLPSRGPYPKPEIEDNQPTIYLWQRCEVIQAGEVSSIIAGIAIRTNRVLPQDEFIDVGSIHAQRM